MPNSMSFLGLAMKAGRLEVGEENVGACARAKKAKVILLAQDASENAQHRARNFASAGNVSLLHLPCTKQELGASVGKATPSMAAVTDIEMASAFVDKLAGDNPGKYDDISRELKEKADRAKQRRKEAKSHKKNVKPGKRRTK